MTRTVFSNAMVAHVFINQSQGHGRSGNGNFHFSGSILYSYRTPIARFVKAPDGTRVLLRTSETFSVTTTSKHESAVGHALPSNPSYPVFYVPSLGDSYATPDHAANFAHYVKGARDLLAKWKTKRFDTWDSENVAPSDYMEFESFIAQNTDSENVIPRFIFQAIRRLKVAREYAELFGLIVEFDGAAEVASTVTNWKARKAAYNTPEAAKRREQQKAAKERAEERKAEAKRLARLEAMLEQFRNWKAGTASRPHSNYFTPGSPEYVELMEAEAAEKAQAARESHEAFQLWRDGKAPRPTPWRYEYGTPERLTIDADIQAEKAREEAGKLAAWRNGSSLPFYGYDESGIGAALRVRCNRDGWSEELLAAGRYDSFTVETSHGATVPLAHAVKAFQFMRLVWSRGETWQRNGKTIRVGHFQVDRIDADKVTAGCHVLMKAEIESFAARIGLADVTPDDSAVEHMPAHVAA